MKCKSRYEHNAFSFSKACRCLSALLHWIRQQIWQVVSQKELAKACHAICTPSKREWFRGRRTVCLASSTITICHLLYTNFMALFLHHSRWNKQSGAQFFSGSNVTWLHLFFWHRIALCNLDSFKKCNFEGDGVKTEPHDWLLLRRGKTLRLAVYYNTSRNTAVWDINNKMSNNELTAMQNVLERWTGEWTGKSPWFTLETELPWKPGLTHCWGASTWGPLCATPRTHQGRPKLLRVAGLCS